MEIVKYFYNYNDLCNYIELLRANGKGYSLTYSKINGISPKVPYYVYRVLCYGGDFE